MWRIEAGAREPAMCRHCGRSIAPDQARFGKPSQAKWFHLACAADGVPQEFAPHRARAEKLAGGELAPPPAAIPRVAWRHRDLEAALLADPDDRELREVFADGLQSAGDPWGELIAFAHASNSEEFERVLHEHAGDLTGGYDPRLLTWRNGFIDAVHLHALGPAKALPILEGILALRTTLLARDLSLPTQLDKELAATLVARAPRGLRKLRVHAGDGLPQLAIPSLAWLELKLPEGMERTFVQFLARLATSFPQLDTLVLNGMPLTGGMVDALLDNEVVRGLDYLGLNYQVILGASEQVLVARRAALDGVKRMTLFGTDATRGAFLRQLAAM